LTNKNKYGIIYHIVLIFKKKRGDKH